MAVFPRRRTRIEGVVLDAGERILASASGDTGTMVATDKRLLVPGSGGHHGIGWESVDRATWEQVMADPAAAGSLDAPG